MKILDLEANGLNPDRIWCVCTIDVDTGEEYVWRYDTNGMAKVNLSNTDVCIGHNILGYDLPNINRLMGVGLLDIRCVDTLVCSRTFSSHLDGHSLEDWGERLGFKKGDFNEWEAYDDVVLEQDRMDRCVLYCMQDCRITLALYNYLKKYIYDPAWKDALRCEHDTAVLCRELHENGFMFDEDRAIRVHGQISRIVEDLDVRLQQAFPPRSQLVREVHPRLTKHGTLSRIDFRWYEGDDLTSFSADAPFSLIRFVPFNPRSSSQAITILNEAGWEPYEKTKGHIKAVKELNNLRKTSRNQRGYRVNRGRDNGLGERIREIESKIEIFKCDGWRLSENNLDTLPPDAPEGCKLFIKYRMLSKRLDTLKEWAEAYEPKTQRIYGDFHHIGAWTHRKSHSHPNQGNVPSIHSKYHNPELKELAAVYGKEMRSCFIVPPNKVLVGVDADGIQLRILAHYMDDPEFTEALVNGDKSKGTDAHTLNAIALGLTALERDRAKTFIYAWLLGAGMGKVGQILGCTTKEAVASVQSFIDRYVGLKRLKGEIIPNDAARGYFVGFDGRKVGSDEYHMLAGYLQCGESLIMKHAAIHWNKECKSLGLDFKFVNDVHDEWQTECNPEEAGEVAFRQTESIRWAGEKFGLKCPMLGQSKYGLNWYETH